MISNIFHFPSVVVLHDPTVRCVLVIAQGNFRLERLYVHSPCLCMIWWSPATPAGWSNRFAWESCLSDKHHIRSPRFQWAFIIIRVSANSVVHCQITKISICILIHLSTWSNADATPLVATAILDLRSTQSWFSIKTDPDAGGRTWRSPLQR